jgi:hypothetical protein
MLMRNHIPEVTLDNEEDIFRNVIREHAWSSEWQNPNDSLFGQMDEAFLKRYGGRGHTFPRPPSPKPHEGPWSPEELADNLLATCFHVPFQAGEAAAEFLPAVPGGH